MNIYRRPKFLEILLEIRREMALEADYDVDLFAEMARSGSRTEKSQLSADRDTASPSALDRTGNIVDFMPKRTRAKG